MCRDPCPGCPYDSFRGCIPEAAMYSFAGPFFYFDAVVREDSESRGEVDSNLIESVEGTKKVPIEVCVRWVGLIGLCRLLAAPILPGIKVELSLAVMDFRGPEAGLEEGVRIGDYLPGDRR